MTGTAQDVPIRVSSQDGTSIGVFVSGRGRPLVVVPGTTSDHTTWRRVTPLLEPHRSVYAVDRRGRGVSGDGPAYSLEAEYADVAAVVDAAAGSTGEQVDLLGHSYGGNVAFGAAALSRAVRRLVLYEGWPVPNRAHRAVPAATMEELDALLVGGDREGLLERFYREVALMTAVEVATLRSAPTWPARVAAAHTVPRELHAFGAHAFDARVAAGISVPTLLLVGSDSPAEIQADPEIVAAALPDARIEVLEGQAHLAHLTDPEGFVRHVLRFLDP